MPFCPNCGKELPPEAVSCPGCGHLLQAAPPAPQAVKRTGFGSPRNLAIYSLICAVAALLILPAPLLVLGVVLGFFAMRRGERTLGRLGIILSIVLGLIGWYLSYLYLVGGL